MTVREYIQENWKNSIRKGEYKNLPYPYLSHKCPILVLQGGVKYAINITKRIIVVKTLFERVL